MSDMKCIPGKKDPGSVLNFNSGQNHPPTALRTQASGQNITRRAAGYAKWRPLIQLSICSAHEVRVA